MGNKKQKFKQILVTGDIVQDHYIYKGKRIISGSNESIGTNIKNERGGAGLLFNILNYFSDQLNSKYKVNIDFDEKAFENLPSNRQAYSVWEPYPYEFNSKEFVWRLTLPMGYGELSNDRIDYLKYSKEVKQDHNIIVIDDGAMGYRYAFSKCIWPKEVLKESKNLDWIVYKMSRPIVFGDLLSEINEKNRKKLILLISIDELRALEIRVSSKISWDKTAADLIQEIENNSVFKNILKCKYLVINFQSEGALIVENISIKKRIYTLIFDPEFMEGEWGKHHPGDILGCMSCLVTGVAHSLVLNQTVEMGVKCGLSAIRTLVSNGRGLFKPDSESPKFPLSKIYDEVNKPSKKYFSVIVNPSDIFGRANGNEWTIINSSFKSESKVEVPLYSIAYRYAIWGKSALTNIPYAQFGFMFTVDRAEIESLRNLKKLTENYEETDKGKKPLSIAVFGPPGAGKSFGVKQIAKTVLGNDVSILEFNLSQFTDPSELIGAFHQVRDKVLRGKTPVVFWDEFDSQKYRWLQYLLAPMQDGVFQEGQLIHPIGKCIFIFAGATSDDIEHFGPDMIDGNSDDIKDFKLKKGPDFISRVHGYLNVMGPNPKQKIIKSKDKKGIIHQKKIDDKKDVCFPIRRAILLRSLLGIRGSARLNIDRGVLSALLKIGRYKHGARSFETTLKNMKNRDGKTILRSNIPTEEIMSLHADYHEFIKIVNEDIDYKSEAKVLAPTVHNYYRDLGKREGWLTKKMDVEFNQLAAEYIDDNIAAAQRIYRALELVGLTIVKDKESAKTLSDSQDEMAYSLIVDYLELLSEVEHEGWMKQKLLSGWIYGKKRDDDAKNHDCLCLYSELDDFQKEKDREVVRKYVEILKSGIFKIVFKENQT